MEKKMRKLLALLLVAVVLGSGSLAWAVQLRNVPRDQNNAPMGHPLYGGYQYYRKTYLAEQVICTSKCLLAGLVMSTGVNTNRVRIRDTSGQDGGGTIVFDPIRFEPNSQVGRNPIVLPVLMENGISVEFTNITNAENVTVIYLDLD